MREHLSKVCKRSHNPLIAKLCYLPTCHYCFSHWVALLFLWLTGYRLLFQGWRGFVVAEFTLVMFANVYLTIYNLLRLRVRILKAKAEREEALAQLAKDQLKKSTAKEEPQRS